jgi:hypothetical protein
MRTQVSHGNASRGISLTPRTINPHRSLNMEEGRLPLGMASGHREQPNWPPPLLGSVRTRPTVVGLGPALPLHQSDQLPLPSNHISTGIDVTLSIGNKSHGEWHSRYPVWNQVARIAMIDGFGAYRPFGTHRSANLPHRESKERGAIMFE